MTRIIRKGCDASMPIRKNTGNSFCMCVKQHENVGCMKFNYKEMQFDLGKKVKLGINKIF